MANSPYVDVVWFLILTNPYYDILGVRFDCNLTIVTYVHGVVTRAAELESEKNVAALTLCLNFTDLIWINSDYILFIFIELCLLSEFIHFPQLRDVEF